MVKQGLSMKVGGAFPGLRPCASTLARSAPSLTPEERALVPDCPREALRDEHPWVRLEADDAMTRDVEDPDKDMRRHVRRARVRLERRARGRQPWTAFVAQ